MTVGGGPPGPVEPVSVDDHLLRVLDAVRPAAPVPLPLADALDLLCAEDVSAPLQLPRFDNSAMDGYAVRVADVAGASPDAPVTLPVAGQIGAGQGGPRELPAGAVAKIMTGAPVPAGAEAVVPYEWTDRGGDTVTITRAPSARQHVRPAGDDVRRGDRLVPAGTRLGPRQLGLLAAVGLPTVLARPRPRVAVLSTGAELRAPGEPLDHGAIHDGNSTLLTAAAARAGAVPVPLGIVADDPDAFLERLAAAVAGAEVVVTSGGVSQGDFDVVKAALRPRGVWFGAVAMQPGKPQGFGVLDGVPFFGLPGNPVSSYLSFELFVRPVLRRLMGLVPEVEPLERARLSEPVRSPQGRRQFLRGRHDPTNGTVVPVGGPGSHLVADLAAADALVVVPEDVTELPAGAEVAVVPLDRGSC